MFFTVDHQAAAIAMSGLQRVNRFSSVGFFFFSLFNDMQKLSNRAKKSGLSECLALRASQPCRNLGQSEALAACVLVTCAGTASAGNQRGRKSSLVGRQRVHARLI